MFGELERAMRRVEEAIADLDGRAHDPAAVLELLVGHEHRMAAARTRWAGLAATQGAHRRAGQLTAERWLAQMCGTSTAEAKATLGTADALDRQPLLRQAFADGQLSAAQAREVARGATADPGAEAALIAAAARRDLGALRREAQRVVAAADSDPAASQRRIHRNRAWRRWTEDDGTWVGMLRTTTAVGAEIEAAIGARTDAIFAEARREGRREPREAYAADAATEALCGQPGSEGKARPPRRDLVIHVDYPALLRGRTVSGEMCEIEGVGPVPVEVAADFDADPFIKTVIRNGTDIRTVHHFGRHIPAVLQTALDARTQLEDHRCSECGQSFARLETDHIVPHAAHGPTSYTNLEPKCPTCHRNKSLRDRRNGLTHANRPPPHADEANPP